MSLFDYLGDELVVDGGPSWEVASWVDVAAHELLGQAVDPALVEMASEHLARAASVLGAAELGRDSAIDGLSYLALPPLLLELLAAALLRPRRADEVAALAVHLVDVAERMALGVFLSELPALTAKADRTGGAARNVGVARHLKG